MKFKKIWILYFVLIYLSACANSTTGGVTQWEANVSPGLSSDAELFERFNCPTTDNVTPVYQNYDLGLVGRAKVCIDQTDSKNLLIRGTSLFYQSEVCMIPLYFDASTGSTLIYPSSGSVYPFQMLCKNIDHSRYGTEFQFDQSVNAVFIVEGGVNALQLQDCLAKGDATKCPGASLEIDAYTHDPKYYSFGRLDYNRF